MRILVANIPLPANRFLVDLNAALARVCDVTHSSDIFWNMDGDYDVVHLHFPEYLTYEVERAYVNGLELALIAEVKKRLEFWAKRSLIVVTRHVLLPHDASADERWEMMYETVYRFADGVVHFGTPSVSEFKARYATTVFNRGHAPAHVVIPHHNYASLPNEVSREEARRRLGLAANAEVLLIFGMVRSNAERELILETFQAIRQPNKILLVSRWRENLADVEWIRLKYWLRDLTRLYYRLHPQYRLNYGFVEESDTQLYVNAADVLFIPRLRVLNSGNITLGMTFGRVVVGPDSWDIGELLRSTGNPVFDPDDPSTAAAAVEQAFQLAKAGKVGAMNREHALRHWTPQQCADQYVNFFRLLTP